MRIQDGMLELLTWTQYFYEAEAPANFDADFIVLSQLCKTASEVLTLTFLQLQNDTICYYVLNNIVTLQCSNEIINYSNYEHVIKCFNLQ